jgi:hypothetical protein
MSLIVLAVVVFVCNLAIIVISVRNIYALRKEEKRLLAHLMAVMDMKRKESFPCPICRMTVESKELYAEPFRRFMGTSVYWCFRQVNISLVTLNNGDNN